ncbi:MAG: ParB/RepB/Spo0J family partition protein [Anaerolineales bacterium]|nr:ParB/RepB/Spo0J family partition protein [Anaerolineales bacterium]
MSRKSGLGKGLDALIPTGDAPSPSAGGVLHISLDDVSPNPRQPRVKFDPDQLRELADSIVEHGVLQPLIVTPSSEGKGYQLIVGERRWQAARLAGLETIPAIVRDVTDQDQLVIALIENLQRADLNPLEAADGYKQLADEFDLSHEAIAMRVGKSRTAISNTLRLLKLSAAVREALQENKISEGHARALLSLPTAQAQSAALQSILNQDLNVRQTEELVRNLSGERRTKKRTKQPSPDIVDIEEKLRQALGTRVTLKKGPRGGSIVIRFYSDEELDALLDRLMEDSSES